MEWTKKEPLDSSEILIADDGRRTLSKTPNHGWWWQARAGDHGTPTVYDLAPTREEAEARIALVLPLLDAAHTAIKAALWERDIAAKARGMATEVAS